MNRFRLSLRILLASILLLAISGAKGAEREIVRDTVTYRVNFAVSTSVIDPGFGNNQQTLSDMEAFVAGVNADPQRRVVALRLSGSVSPEGPEALNKRLVRERAGALREWLRDKLPESGNITVVFVPAIEEQAAQRDDWPAMRFAEAGFVVEIITDTLPETEAEDSEAVYEEPGEVMEETVTAAEPEIYQQSGERQRHIFLKTNVIGWGMMISNLAVEWQFADNWSAALPVYYSGVNYFHRDLKFRTLTIQPELRWLPRGANGFFVGVHGGIGWFNYALRKEYRYQDHGGHHPAAGGGVSIGSRFNLTRSGRWRMEWSLGAGVYAVSYDKYLNCDNGPRVAESIKKTWIGIDNAAISFIYTFDIRK